MKLTHSQQLIATGQRLFPESPLNNMAFAFRWKKAIKVEAMREAFNRLLEQSENMRLRIDVTGEEQSVLPFDPEGYELPLLNLSNKPDVEQAANDWLSERTQRVFPLDGPLFEATLLRLGAEDFILFLNQHHLITDGWSNSIQFNFLERSYSAILRGVPIAETLPKFSDYVTYESKVRNSEAHLAARRHWAENMTDLPELPRLYGNDNPELTSASTRIKVVLDEGRIGRLRAVCQEEGVRNWSEDLSRFNLFATVLFALLYRISGQRELAIGSPAHNRSLQDHRLTPGLFIELFPLAATVEDEDSYADLLAKVSVETMSFLRQARTGSSVVALGKGFNTLLNFVNQSMVDEQQDDFSVTWLHNGHSEPAHQLKLQIFDFDASGQLTLSFDLNNDVFPVQYRQLAVDHYLELLDVFLEDRNTKILAPTTGDLVRQSDHEPLKKTYPRDKSIVDLLDEAAKRYDNLPAVTVDGGETLNYQELHRRAERLADHLHAHGVAYETPVAICLDRSLDMIVGLIGILKAGGAYVPIDPEYPAGRRSGILAGADIKHVLASEARSGFFTNFAGKLTVIDRDWSTIASAPKRNVRTSPKTTNLMYIIYTSGSTGRPKGVMNQHDGLVNRLLWAQDTFQLRAGEDVVLQKTNFCFDVSVWEFFWPLMTGARLVLAKPEGHKDNRYLEDVIRRERITTMHFVPPMLETFLLGAPKSHTLRRVLCSGEALKTSQVNNFRRQLPGVELHNLYGPTEAAIDVTHWPAPMDKLTEVRQVPIGKPVANTPLYVLNKAGLLCPVGVAGELHIGGIQVARGYYGRTELTEEKFITIDLTGKGNTQRLYKTGDLARYLPDGNLEFLGRIDHQVKLRGFRIELGEIEAVLAQCTGVLQSTVLVKGMDAEAQLIAYLKTNGGYSEQKCKDQLGAQLPPYMLPTHYVKLDEFPLSNNGKIDRKALLGIEIELETGSGGTAINEFEAMVLHELENVLGMTRLGVEDNFFDLGMHSLTAIRLTNRLTEAFELPIAPRTVFQFPTTRQMAAHLETTIRRLLAEMEDET